MEQKLLYQSLLLAIFLIGLLRVLSLRLMRPKAARLAPGPWKLPVIGSMHHLVNVIPHRALRDLSSVHGPLMMLQVGQVPLVVVSSREMANMVLRTHDANFANRPNLLTSEIMLYGGADIVFSPCTEYWRKLRQLCMAEVLSLKRVLTFRYIREQEIARQVHSIRATGPSSPVDLTAIFHDLAIGIISRAVFGTKQRDAKEFLSAIKTAAALSTGFKIPDIFPTWRRALAAVTGMRRTLEAAHRTVDSALEEIIEERKAGGGRAATVDEAAEVNLVDVLVGLQEQGDLGFDLSRDSIKAVVFDMFVGGTGTLALTLSWGMSELMRNWRVMCKAQGEVRAAFRGTVAAITEADLRAASLPYLKLVVKETLRLHPSVPLLVPRESVEACEIGGYTIPARSRVIVNVWAIGRDGRYWDDDAEEFRPERFEGSSVDFRGGSCEYLPFGAGRRLCPGIDYALPVMEMMLAQLLYHFDWSLPEGVTELDMTEAPGISIHRKSPLLLCATPFVPNTGQ